VSILTLAVNLDYGLARLAWRGLTIADLLREMGASASYLVLGLFLAAVGLILGKRLQLRKEKPGWNGLLAGIALALTVLVAGWTQGRLDFWLPPNALMAAIGGWLGDRS
jgi:hypothetical protein